MLTHALALALFASESLAYTLMENDSGATIGWTQMPIRFALNPDNPFGLGEDEVEAAVLNAVGSWEAVGADIAFEYLGFSDVAETGYDGENAVFFSETWDGAHDKAAITSDWSTADGAIVAFDVALNAEDWEYTTSDVAPVMDVENVMTHELGHVLGLGHSDIDDLATMWATTSRGDLLRRSLRPDDENGLVAAYGMATPMGLACSSSGTGQAGVGWLLGATLAAGLCSRRRKG